MILSRKTTYCLLLALVLGTICFRYPLDVPHELGADTTFIHTLSTAIVERGYAPWILHPSSYFGLYALSYPSAIPFFFAASSAMSGITIEGVMLLFGWVLSSTGVAGAFLVARRIRRDDPFALLVAAFFSIAPFFVKDTFWVGSARGFVVALLPVFLLLSVTSLQARQIRLLVLATVVFVILSAIHRMGFLAFFIVVAYVFAIPFHRLTQRLRFALARFERGARFATFGSAFIGFFVMFYVQFLYPGIAGANVFDQYGAGALLSGSSFPVLLANMGVSLTGKIGPLFPLAIVGLAAYAWRRPKEATDKFFLTTMFLFVPLLSLRDYIGEFLIPFFVILTVVGLVALYKKVPGRRKLLAVVLAGIVIASAGFSWQMKDYWRNRYVTDGTITNSAYDAGVYIEYSTDGTVLSNDGLAGGQLAAVSGKPVLPLGGASLHWTSPQQLMWCCVPQEGVRVRLLDFSTITFNSDEIYVPVNVGIAEADWETMLFYRDPFLAERKLTDYNVTYVAVNLYRPYTFNSYGLDRPSIYLSSILPSTSYVVYSNGAFQVWLRG